MSTIHKYFHIFQHAFLASFIDEVIEFDDYCMFFSHSVKSPEWNAVSNVHMAEGMVGEGLLDIELIFAEKHLAPVLWISKDDTPWGLEDFIQNRAYSYKHTDVWMTKDNIQEDTTFFTMYDLVEVKEGFQLDDFLKVYAEVYPNDVNDFAPVFKDKLFDAKFKDRSKLYIAYHNGHPVSIIGCIKEDVNAFLHSMATLPDHRKKGYSSALTHFAAVQSGATKVIVQTNGTVEAQNILGSLGFHELMQVKVYQK